MASIFFYICNEVIRVNSSVRVQIIVIMRIGMITNSMSLISYSS